METTSGRAFALLVISAVAAGCGGPHLAADATPEDIITYAEERLAARSYLDAAEALEFFLQKYPGTAQTPRAKLRLGDARFGAEEYVLAQADYQDVVREFPGSPYVEEARWGIARCSYASTLPYNLDQTETERSIRLLEEFLRDYPASRFRPEVEEALGDCRERLAHGDYEAGRFYMKQDRMYAAKIQFEHVVNEYPNVDWACRARFFLGEVHRVREKYDDAALWYQRTIDACPDGAEAGLAERALQKLSREEGLDLDRDTERASR